MRDYGTATWEGGDAECDHNPQHPDGGQRGDRSLPLGRGGTYKDICGKCGAKRIDNQLGLEKTPEEYVAKMVEIFREVRRVLKDNGTVWLNLGDSYFGSNCGYGDFRGNKSSISIPTIYGSIKKPQANQGKPKDLVGIPWRVAFALQVDGWWLRQDIIWHKPSCMPESVTDRCTKAHEYIFLLSKNAKYYYNAEAIKERTMTFDNSNRDRDNTKLNNTPGRSRMGGLKTNHYSLRNKRSVWTVSTKPYKESHFATFPIALIEPCILAGTDKGDIILDPFFGAGTTGVAAYKYGRKFVGIELNLEYCGLSAKRIESETSQLKLWR